MLIFLWKQHKVFEFYIKETVHICSWLKKKIISVKDIALLGMLRLGVDPWQWVGSKAPQGLTSKDWARNNTSLKVYVCGRQQDWRKRRRRTIRRRVPNSKMMSTIIHSSINIFRLGRLCRECEHMLCNKEAQVGFL